MMGKHQVSHCHVDWEAHGVTLDFPFYMKLIGHKGTVDS